MASTSLMRWDAILAFPTPNPAGSIKAERLHCHVTQTEQRQQNNQVTWGLPKLQDYSHRKSGFSMKGRWQQAAISAGQRESRPETGNPFPGEPRSQGAGQDGQWKEGAASTPTAQPQEAPGMGWSPWGTEGGWASPSRGLGQVRISSHRLDEKGAPMGEAWPRKGRPG